MPSGKTHDLTTLLTTPLLWVCCTDYLAWTPLPTLWLCLGFLAGGLLLSPDLDTLSRPFYRWGYIRFIWWPYQWMAKHRSGLSHGILLAAWLRLIYLSAVCILVYSGIAWLLTHSSQGTPSFHSREQIWALWQHYQTPLLLIGWGVWLGSLLHIVMDFCSTCLTQKHARRSSKPTRRTSLRQ